MGLQLCAQGDSRNPAASSQALFVRILAISIACRASQLVMLPLLLMQVTGGMRLCRPLGECVCFRPGLDGATINWVLMAVFGGSMPTPHIRRQYLCSILRVPQSEAQMLALGRRHVLVCACSCQTCAQPLDMCMHLVSPCSSSMSKSWHPLPIDCRRLGFLPQFAVFPALYVDAEQPTSSAGTGTAAGPGAGSSHMNPVRLGIFSFPPLRSIIATYRVDD
jgi:hypothetical protein